MDIVNKKKKAAEKRKLGTTILPQTEANIYLFKEQHPDQTKTAGEVIDLMALLSLRVNPGAAAELRGFCAKRANAAERESYEIEEANPGSLQAADLRERADYFRALGAHMGRFVPAEKEHNDDTPMKRIDMRKGAYVVVPCDWVVANESSARSCDYAFAVEVRNGEKYDAPHFLVLSEKETCSLDEAVESVEKTWPAIRDVVNAQVGAIRDESGSLLNAEEWMEAPSVGVFPIRDSNSFFWDDEPPYGAMVFRR